MAPMSQSATAWILGAILVLGLSAAAMVFGVELLPASATMQSKLGTAVPVFLTWGMIWLTALSGVAVAIFLFATGMSKARGSN